jgi:hypothetical protein
LSGTKPEPTPIPTHKYYTGFIEETGRELLGCSVEAN